MTTSGTADAYTTSLEDSAAVGVPTRFWWELVIVLWLYFLYDIINNLSPVSRVNAFAHAEDILQLERTLRIDIERSMNEWMVGRDLLGSFLANFYNLAHIWLTLAVIVFLWWKRRPLYADLRNALVLFNLIGFLVFWVYPVAPPRMLDGYVDIVETSGAISSFHSGTLAGAANQFAAMPSLHIAWAIWCVVAVHRSLHSRRWRVAIWVHLALTCIAVVATANHFVLDIVAGAATAAVGFFLASRFATRWRPQLVRRRTLRALQRA